MTPEDAHRHARRQLGNQLLLRDSSRDIKLFPRLESIVQDAAFGLRLCRKNMIVTAVAVVSLSLAIGACGAAFSLIDALILRPLPVKDPERLVYAVYRAPTDPQDRAFFNYPRFERMRDAGRTQVQLFGMSFQLDWRLLAFLAGAGSVVMFLFGLGPAFRASAVSPNDALKAGAGKHVAPITALRHE